MRRQPLYDRAARSGGRPPHQSHQIGGAFALLSPRAFPTVNNFTNVLNQTSLAMIIAAGLTLAVVVGELDLSVGFAASLHGILVTGLIVSNKLPIPIAVLIVLAAGAFIGLVNGLIVTKVRVNSVIATLGVGTILTGLAFAYSAGVPIVAGVPEAFLQLSLGRWLYGIPNDIVVMVVIVGGLWVLVERTALGQEIQAVGGNPAAARLAGIDVDRIKILGFVISGTSAALTGILLASRLGEWHRQRGRQLPPDRLRSRVSRLRHTARRRVPRAWHLCRRAHHRLRLQRPQHLRGADLLAVHSARRHPHRRGGALEPRPLHRGKLKSMTDQTSATWNVHVIEFARSRQQRMAGLIHGAPFDEMHDLPFSFVLARCGTAIVLVDTGFMREGSGEAMSVKFDVPYWISPLRMLAEMGVGPDDVTDIVLSHAHFDHMGSIGKFPKARLHIQKREILSWHEAIALPREFGFLTEIINPDDLRAAFDAAVEHRLNLVDGDVDDLLPGLHVRLGQGHTMGQQFILIETARGRLVISGDCVYSRRNICGHDHSGVYLPLTNAIGAAWDQLKTIDRINKAIQGDLDRLIILHDADRWKGMAIVHEIDGFRIVRVS